MGYICSPYLLTKSANQNSHQMAKTKLKPEIKTKVKKSLKLMASLSEALDGISFYTLKRRIDNDNPCMVSVDILKIIGKGLKMQTKDLTH